MRQIATSAGLEKKFDVPGIVDVHPERRQFDRWIAPLERFGRPTFHGNFDRISGVRRQFRPIHWIDRAAGGDRQVPCGVGFRSTARRDGYGRRLGSVAAL